MPPGAPRHRMGPPPIIDLQAGDIFALRVADDIKGQEAAVAALYARGSLAPPPSVVALHDRGRLGGEPEPKITLSELQKEFETAEEAVLMQMNDKERRRASETRNHLAYGFASSCDRHGPAVLKEGVVRLDLEIWSQ